MLRTDLTWEEYHNERGVNYSVLKRVEQSPAHAKHYIDLGFIKDSPAMMLGRAIHCIVFEPETFNSRFARLPEINRRTNIGKEAYDTFLQANYGKDCLKGEDYETCFKVAEAVRTHKASIPLLSGIHAEASIFWTDETTGLPCKARLDGWNEELAAIVDLKTTTDASHSEFRRTVEGRGYASQAAWYMRGARAIGLAPKHFCFIAAEKEPPWGVQVFRLSESLLARCDERNTQLLAQFAQCLANNEWPCYSEKITEIGTEEESNLCNLIH